MVATHNGTCQVCGRLQALSHLGIAKHGYQVAGYGYFHGICPGAGHDALEQSRVQADRVGIDLRRQATSSRQHAEWVRTGVSVPLQAKSGRRVVNARHVWEDELVPFEQAPIIYQAETVNLLARRHDSDARIADQIADDIFARADRITGKQQLQPRVTDAPRKVLGPGSRVRLFGKSGYDVTVVRIESQLVKGCGPFLNGQHLPHIVYVRDGSDREFGYPVRLVKQSAIIS